MTTLVVQDDEGDVANANSYITLAFFQSYHTNRGNVYSDSTDDEVKAGIIRATDYLDTRFDFRGVRLNAGIEAHGTYTLSTVPNDGDTVTIGDETWTFRTAPSVAFDIQIGVSAAITLQFLVLSVDSNSESVSTSLATATTMAVVAITSGAAGNDIETSAASSGSWAATTLEDGADQDQTTEWPRKAGTSDGLAATQTIDTAGFFLAPISLDDSSDSTINLIDRNGKDIVGIPIALKRACAEYAFRALSIPLFQDAPAPEGGRLLDLEHVTVDVISQMRRFASPQSGSFVMPAYPAADLLLSRAGLIASGRSLMR